MAKFFDTPIDGEVAQAVSYDAPRVIQGSAERLAIKGKAAERREKQPTREWQTAAFRYFDSIGEVHFAFSLIAQVISRIRIFPAILADQEEHPIYVRSWLDSLNDQAAPASQQRADAAIEIMDDLVRNTPGRTSGLMRTMALNLSVPGEVYLAQVDKQWLALSCDELSQTGTGSTAKWRVQRSKTTGVGRQFKEIPGDAFVARIWRTHPRWHDEPDSSMVGVLDQCLKLELLDAAMRAMARRAMNAGVVFVPTGISAYAVDGNEETIADVLAKAALQSVESEAAIETVTPKVLEGPPELGDKIKRISLTDPVDAAMDAAADRCLERILQGLDIPKDAVKGLASVKFANAIVIDDNLYRAHIEPLILLIVDALTTVYLQPMLRKRFGDDEAIERIVVWYDPSAIVTRPDKSQAADVGYDKKLLSGEAWRRARGFTEAEAPDEDELLTRLALEKAPIPPEMAASLIERLHPAFFAGQRKAAQSQAGFPDDLSQLLDGEGVTPVPAEPSGQDLADQLSGGQVNPNGSLPPRPAVV